MFVPRWQSSWNWEKNASLLNEEKGLQ
jgi:NTE family protein